MLAYVLFCESENAEQSYPHDSCMWETDWQCGCSPNLPNQSSSGHHTVSVVATSLTHQLSCLRKYILIILSLICRVCVCLHMLDGILGVTLSEAGAIGLLLSLCSVMSYTRSHKQTNTNWQNGPSWVSTAGLTGFDGLKMWAERKWDKKNIWKEEEKEISNQRRRDALRGNIKERENKR